MKRLLILCFIHILNHANMYAQTQHSVAVGMGTANVLDTYLSPYNYKGTGVAVQRETQRRVTTFGINNINFQTLLDLNAQFLDNPAKNVDGLAGGARYALAWKKHIRQWNVGMAKISLEAGPMASAYIGAVYNDRNGNNPAQAKADIMIDATAAAKCEFRALKKNMTLSYQLAFPLAGLAFSPNYGQSYYEAFVKDDYDKNIVFANFVNMTSARHMLNLDIQVSSKHRTACRIAYLGYFMQSRFNSLRYHSYTNSFLIGFTKFFKTL